MRVGVRLACATALGAAVLAGAGASGGGAQPSAEERVWVGTLTLVYQRNFDLPRPDGGVATERDLRRLTITNRPGGTAVATVRVRSRNEYPCSSGGPARRIEEWDLVQRVRPLRVTFVRNRYQISFTNPSDSVEIEEASCTSADERNVRVWAMNVGFQLFGRAAPGAKRIKGSWRSAPACTGACLVHFADARWDLRSVPARR